MQKITPLGKNILIKLAEAEKITKSGIILPGKEGDEKSQQGEVVAVGKDDKINKSIKPGAKVLFEKYEGSEIEMENEKYIVIESKKILALIQ